MVNKAAWFFVPPITELDHAQAENGLTESPPVSESRFTGFNDYELAANTDSASPVFWRTNMLERNFTESQPAITNWLGSAFEVLLQLENESARQAASGPMLQEPAAMAAEQSSNAVPA